MRIRTVCLIIVCFACAELAAGVWLIGAVQPAEIDMVKLNELTHACTQAWPLLEQGRSVQMPASDYDYAVLDREGRLLYAARLDLDLTLQKAIQNRATLVDLYQQGQPVGKLVLLSDTARQAEGQARRLLLFLALNTALCLLFWLAYAHYLNRRIIRPFQQLKTFAVRVANGNLDIPLAMDRDNAFGAFTESFDLMRDELRRARERERAANQSKKELVAKLSHDIKTPIASIKAVAEVMAVRADGDKERQQLSIIESKADQVDALISNLFHATLEELQELEVNPSFQSSHELRALISQADYLEKADIGEIPECLALFDSLRLQQVFDNLVGNSYKYAGTSLRVTAELTKQSLVLRFRDDGPGVSPEELPLLSEKFYRGSNASDKGGAGLGLFISRYLIGQMGGSLTCQNMEPGFQVCVELKI